MDERDEEMKPVLNKFTKEPKPLRKIFRITEEEVKIEDLKKGDRFLMYPSSTVTARGKQLDSETGNEVYTAQADGYIDDSGEGCVRIN